MLKAGGGDDRGWDGRMVSPTQWTWVWVNSGSWWWTGRPGVLQSMGVAESWTQLSDWTELTELRVHHTHLKSPVGRTTPLVLSCISSLLLATQPRAWVSHGRSFTSTHQESHNPSLLEGSELKMKDTIVPNLKFRMVCTPCVCVCVLVIQLYPTLCDPMDCTHQASLSMGFYRQEYWSELPFPSQWDPPNPGMERASPTL